MLSVVSIAQRYGFSFFPVCMHALRNAPRAKQDVTAVLRNRSKPWYFADDVYLQPMEGGAPKSNDIHRTSQCLFSCFLILVPGSIPEPSAGSACLLAPNLICRNGGKYDDINGPQRLSPRSKFKMLFPTRDSPLHHASNMT